ncbi:hypothetical protein A2U01_0110551, partial [Trifolium medium]|nr:hypothetical protein [Trifolium medium]
MNLETPHVAKRDKCDTLRGDAPLGGAHQEEVRHLLDTTVNTLQSRRNATRDLYRGGSWISH